MDLRDVHLMLTCSFFIGKGAFEMAFVQNDVENDGPGNEVHAGDSCMLELCSQLHCDLCELSCWIHNCHFAVSLLLSAVDIQ